MLSCHSKCYLCYMYYSSNPFIVCIGLVLSFYSTCCIIYLFFNSDAFFVCVDLFIYCPSTCYLSYLYYRSNGSLSATALFCPATIPMCCPATIPMCCPATVHGVSALTRPVLRSPLHIMNSTLSGLSPWLVLEVKLR